MKDNKSVAAEFGALSIKDQFYPSTSSLPSAILNISNNPDPIPKT